MHVWYMNTYIVCESICAGAQNMTKAHVPTNKKDQLTVATIQLGRPETIGTISLAGASESSCNSYMKVRTLQLQLQVLNLHSTIEQVDTGECHQEATKPLLLALRNILIQ